MRDQFIRNDTANYLGYRFDDDFLFIDNRDEQYSGGIEFEWLKPLKNTREKQGVFNPFKNGNRVLNSVFGTLVFTPYNISDSLVILNDRPFSSYIFTSIGLTSFNKSLTKRLTTELYLGLMGSQLPGKVQAALHTIGESAPANGWKNKIAPKVFFVPNIKIHYQKSILLLKRFDFLNFKAIQYLHTYRLNTGLYLNNISFGPKIIFYDHLPQTESIHQIICLKEPDSRARNHKLSIYFNPQLQLVAYNTSLQGLNWFDSPYTIEHAVLNRHVWILEGGINYSYKRFHLNYTIQAVSKEFKKYPRNWHSWAGINMGFSF